MASFFIFDSAIAVAVVAFVIIVAAVVIAVAINVERRNFMMGKKEMKKKHEQTKECIKF